MKVLIRNSDGYVQTFMKDNDVLSVTDSGNYLLHSGNGIDPDIILSYATPQTSTLIENVDDKQFDLTGTNEYQYLDGAFSLIIKKEPA